MNLVFLYTSALARRLALRKVDESEAALYYGANTLLGTVVLYNAYLIYAPLGWLLSYELFVVMVAVFYGVRRCYQINGGREGVDFVLRATCLSFPIALKLNLVSMFLVGTDFWALYALFGASSLRNPEAIAYHLSYLWGPILTAVFFWRLSLHLAYVRSLELRQPEAHVMD